MTEEQRTATCATCRFWKADYHIEDQPSEVGTCRLNPPQLVVVADERYALWPETDRDEWCGRYNERRVAGRMLPFLPPNTEVAP